MDTSVVITICELVKGRQLFSWLKAYVSIEIVSSGERLNNTSIIGFVSPIVSRTSIVPTCRVIRGRALLPVRGKTLVHV